ncbi:WYL domain-containing protein [Chromobacterium amazonense]|uniref:WYL domain-containing protein n=1 Tax=Chromobacterium amazonense TaxID=1382803 RepID=UPI003F7A0C02
MRATIEQAINNRQIIEFNYSGLQRTVEPHVLGISNGVLQLLGYQIAGGSNTGVVPDWRRFDLSGISSLTTTNYRFPGPRPCPSGKHSAWDHTIAIVK